GDASPGSATGAPPHLRSPCPAVPAWRGRSIGHPPPRTAPDDDRRLRTACRRECRGSGPESAGAGATQADADHRLSIATRPADRRALFGVAWPGRETPRGVAFEARLSRPGESHRVE